MYYEGNQHCRVDRHTGPPETGGSEQNFRYELLAEGTVNFNYNTARWLRWFHGFVGLRWFFNIVQQNICAFVTFVL